MEFFERINLRIVKNILLVIIAVCVVFLVVYYSYLLTLRNYVYPIEYKQEVLKESEENGLDWALVFAVIKVESNFNPNALSKKGAVGLMQLKPSTADYVAKLKGQEQVDLYNPKVNIEYGCYYLKYLIEKFKNINTAVCAYNAGEGKVSSWLRNSEYSKDGKTLDTIPFPETKEYLDRIEKTFNKYKKLYGKIVDKE